MEDYLLFSSLTRLGFGGKSRDGGRREREEEGLSKPEHDGSLELEDQVIWVPCTVVLSVQAIVR